MITAILLAAGESSRMGRPKQLLPWDGTTLVEWQAGQLQDGGADEVLIVLGHAADEISATLDPNATGTRLVRNEAYRDGKASSLRKGAAAVFDSPDAIIVASVDQPRPAWVLRLLIKQKLASQAEIVVPRFGGHGGHPVLLDGALLDELRTVTEQDQGLRAVLIRHAAKIDVIEIEDATVNVDLNTPEEYQDALAALEAGVWAEAKR